MSRQIRYGHSSTRMDDQTDPFPAGMRFQKIKLAGVWTQPYSVVYDEDGLMSLTNSATNTDAPFGQGLVVDLSSMASQLTGRQQSMLANYRVSDIQISMRNVDNTDDNNRAHFYQGEIQWLSPNSHLINVVQAFRAIRSEIARLSISDANHGGASSIFEKYFPASSFSPAKPYQGFRFGWHRGDDVAFTDGTLVDALRIHDSNNDDDMHIGSSHYEGLSIASMLQTVEDMQEQGSDENDLYPPNRIWDKRVGIPNAIPFSVGLDNASNDDDAGSVTLSQANNNDASFQDFRWQSPSGTHIDVCTGLMYIKFTHCNATPDVEEALSVHDDHEFFVSIGLEGWSEW